jgi:hypothetical protein
MEAFVMAFAILLAMGEHSGGVLTLGGIIAILLLLNAGLMKKENWLGDWFDSAGCNGFLRLLRYFDVFHGRTFCWALDSGLRSRSEG